MRRTFIARSADDIARVRPFWTRLASRCPATIFQSFDWNLCAARAFGDREWPHVICTESDSGMVLIPTAVDPAHSQLSLIGESMFDYRDILLTGDDSLLTAAWSRAAALGLRFSAGAIRADSQVKRWEGFDVSRFYAAPRVSPRETSANKFAADHNRLGSWLRRLQRKGVELRCHHGDKSGLIRQIYTQKGTQPSENGANLFSDPKRVEFMVDVAAQMNTACEVFTLETAGALVAALVTLRDQNIRRFYTIYFDQGWAKQSPGMVLVYEVTRRSLEAGLECDYMTGEHAYKMRLATSVVPMYWATASANTLATLATEPTISHPAA